MKIKSTQNKVSIFWAVGLVFLYSLLMAEYFDTVNKEVISLQDIDISIYSYISTFNFILTILTVFSVWLISSFLFHLFAFLLNGDIEVDFKFFIKYTGILYVFPAFGFAVSIYLFGNLNLPQIGTLEFLEANKTMVIIGWIINISSLLVFILVIVLRKYLYKVNWLEAVGSFIIPIGLIYILSLYFSESVL